MHTIHNISQNLSIFILDDDIFYLNCLKASIGNLFPKIDVYSFLNKNKLLSNLYKQPSLVILDYNLGVKDSTIITAHSTIEKIQHLYPQQNLVLISGEHNLPLLEEYAKYRSFEFLIKDTNLSHQLKAIVAKKLAQMDVD